MTDTINYDKDKDNDNKWWGNMTWPKLTITISTTLWEQEQSNRLVTWDLTLVTFLTIENNNINIYIVTIE